MVSQCFPCPANIAKIMINIKIVLWTCLVSANLITLIKSCTNPQGDEGECKKITICETMSEILHKRQKTAAEWELIKNSTCGFEGTEPKVCCPFKVPKISNECHTPDGVKGQCIDVYDCPSAVSMLARPDKVSAEDRTFLDKSKCSAPPESFYVCCPPAPPARPGSVFSTRSPVTASAECDWTDPPRDVSPPVPRPEENCFANASIVDLQTRCCGVENYNDDRIFGGSETGIYRYPWMALIEYKINNIMVTDCGGSLISGRYVLTAAHCVDTRILRGRTIENVRLGEYDISNDEADCVEVAGGGQDCTDSPVRIPVDPRRIIIHDLYGISQFQKHDIALIRLAWTATFTTFIAPICLPTVDVAAHTPTGLRLIVAGWGASSNATSRTNLKQHVIVPYVNQTICRARKLYRMLGEGQICAGGEVGKDSCKGDSGGPLMYAKANGRYELIGIVSFGTRICAGEVPAVYTNVFKYRQWIQTHIGTEIHSTLPQRPAKESLLDDRVNKGRGEAEAHIRSTTNAWLWPSDA